MKFTVVIGIKPGRHPALGEQPPLEIEPDPADPPPKPPLDPPSAGTPDAETPP